MNSSSLSNCTGKLAGLFGLVPDEEAGSFLGEDSGHSSSGLDCSAMVGPILLGQDAAVQALHRCLYLLDSEQSAEMVRLRRVVGVGACGGCGGVWWWWVWVCGRVVGVGACGGSGGVWWV